MKTTSGSTTASLSNLPKTYMTHVLYPIFQEKSTENGLRYVRGLQVKLIDSDNVNQAKYHKWVRHIFKNKHNTCLISNFSREIDWEWPRYVRGPPSHAHPRWQRQPGQVPQVEDSAWLTLLTSMGMTWGPLTYLRSFPVDFSWKIGCKTCVMYVFENMTYPLVGLGPDLEAPDLTYLRPLITLWKLGIKHVPSVFLRIWHTHLCDLAWLTLSTSMIMTWRPLTYLRTFPIDFSLKVGYKTWVIHVFDNFDELTGVLPLVVFVDVDGGVHDAKSGWNQF